VAKPRNNISSLLTQLSRSSPGREPKTGGSSGRLSVSGSQDLKSQSLGAKTLSMGLNFGKAPSSPTASTSSSTGELTSLLKQTASSGLASALGGSFGLGSIGGLGSIISSITSLFGGKKTPLPLVAFTLPKAQNETVSLGVNPARTYQGGMGQIPNEKEQGAGIYNTSAAPNHGPLSGQWIEGQSAQIAQAVKTALLNSSSLNDVIAEI
jgi:hypothetical protein